MSALSVAFEKVNAAVAETRLLPEEELSEMTLEDVGDVVRAMQGEAQALRAKIAEERPRPRPVLSFILRDLFFQVASFSKLRFGSGESKLFCSLLPA